MLAAVVFSVVLVVSCVHAQDDPSPIVFTPTFGTLMGGDELVFTAPNITSSGEQVYCRFGEVDQVTVAGEVGRDGLTRCVTPVLYEIGRVPFQVSTDGGSSYSYGANFTAVMGMSGVTLVDGNSKWQRPIKSATSPLDLPAWRELIRGQLTMTWDRDSLDSEAVNVELWGYKEEGSVASWDFMYSVARQVPNTGTYTFSPESKPASEYHIGSIRVTAYTEQEGLTNIRALWSKVHALAWQLEESFYQDPVSWSTERCVAWREQEKEMPDFVPDMPPCPCTLEQALADTGRFQMDPGCSLSLGSTCTYHPGAVHCVRSVAASPDGAGQQCCYAADGRELFTGDTAGGSTPDRGHAFGAPPYRVPPRVPDFSHWLLDVVTFYYCCLWSDNCDVYFELRPTDDCSRYVPPKAGAVFGDPHVITLDGKSYTFNGKGEYTLLQADDVSLRIQVRTAQVSNAQGDLVQTTACTSVAMREGASDTVEVRLPRARESEVPQVLVNGEVIRFDSPLMTLSGLKVISVVPSNVTVHFLSGVGVEVRSKGGVLTTLVLVPPTLKGKTQGLLGRWNDNPDDDFTTPSGDTVPSTADQMTIYNDFGASWAITSQTSLFVYSAQEEATYADKHDPNFTPIVTPPALPAESAEGRKMAQICGDNDQCVFDFTATRSEALAASTRWAHDWYQAVSKDTRKVATCPYVPTPEHGSKVGGPSYVENGTVTIACNEGYVSHPTHTVKCRADGTWDGVPGTCVASNANTAAVAGGVIAGVAVLCVVIGLLVWKMRDDKESTRSEDYKHDDKRESTQET
ncbi:SUSD2 [Branchiostoma lanceolatum]|uniref:SUSD2 protein n=1 Tax=Branchiostoma lanceolatum TaxID=7740 RepID=A0A8J9ZSI1_BRALA|nr:SUSD2 [Branchiostoma lanceolatum]